MLNMLNKNPLKYTYKTTFLDSFLKLRKNHPEFPLDNTILGVYHSIIELFSNNLNASYNKDKDAFEIDIIFKLSLNITDPDEINEIREGHQLLDKDQLKLALLPFVLIPLISSPMRIRGDKIATFCPDWLFKNIVITMIETEKFQFVFPTIVVNYYINYQKEGYNPMEWWRDYVEYIQDLLFIDQTGGNLDDVFFKDPDEYLKVENKFHDNCGGYYSLKNKKMTSNNMPLSSWAEEKLTEILKTLK